jgi:acyl-CoA thioester hydrolase
MKGHETAIAREGRHLYPLRVYYEDTDAIGIVYYANYLRYIERARTEALRELGIAHAELVEQFGVMFVVRRVEMDYLRPARLDDSLLVETTAEEIGGASLVLRQNVLAVEGQGNHVTLVAARVRLACVGADGERPRRIPPRWREGLLALRPATDLNERSTA